MRRLEESRGVGTSKNAKPDGFGLLGNGAGCGSHSDAVNPSKGRCPLRSAWPWCLERP